MTASSPRRLLGATGPPSSTRRAAPQVDSDVVVANVARDYFAIKVPTSRTPPASPEPEPEPEPRPGVATRQPLAPRPAPGSQGIGNAPWEPAPLLERYGITEEEAYHHPKAPAIKVVVAHLDAEATLMVGGVGKGGSSPSARSRSTTPTFAIRQRSLSAREAAAAVPAVPAVPRARPIQPARPPARRAHTARLPGSGGSRWNASALSYSGPGSHAAAAATRVKRGSPRGSPRYAPAAPLPALPTPLPPIGRAQQAT